MHPLKRTQLLILVLLGFALPALGQDRSLSWDSLLVHAQLDAQGVLHVTERHTMRFDGAWNGGERIFALRSRQHLVLRGVSEIDSATQASTPWKDGDLSQVGQYRLNGNTLRWRSRTASEPPFANDVRTYEINYDIERALVADADSYRLEHDLAFPNRQGTIRTFDAVLELDPAWDTVGVPTRWHEENLRPGESVFARASLRYIGAGRPASVVAASSLPSPSGAPLLRYALLSLVIVFVVVQVVALLRREREGGRFEPPTPLAEIDESWLQAHVFDRPPEVVGAAWDYDTSESEVSALLARLAQQGALKTEVRSTGIGWFKSDTLYMELLWDRECFAAHERQLIDALFFGGSRMTDTDKIRRHYSKSGFTPANLIRRGIEAQLPMIFANKLAIPLWSRLVTLALFVAGIGLMIAGLFLSRDAEGPLLASALATSVCFIPGIVFAYIYRVNVYDLRGRLFRALICLCVMYAVLAFVFLSGKVAVVPIALVGLVLLTLALMNMIFNMMRIRDRDESLQLRRKLAIARAYFEHELGSAQPRLKDEWFPYLLAFGLGPKIDRWFKSLAAEGTRASTSTRTSTSPSGGSSRSVSTPTWTGGGGTFGGGGASGAWSAAVGGIAAGVAQPSSSSSGSSGRSSGGGSRTSSGGGGGGGW